ncbi:MAG: sigma-54-dependent Fis family transcriptional regulator, partial [Nitrospirae bacterium]
MRGRVLLIDDEVNTLRVFTNTLMREGFEVNSARSAEEALKMLEENSYDVVVSDIKLPGIPGDKLMEKVKVRLPELPFILITAFATVESAVSAMKRGAYTYLTKPVDTEALVSVIKEAINVKTEDYYNVVEGKHQFFNIIGRSQKMKEVFSLIQRVAKTDANVLILGESGTGKELVARAIHYCSLRADNPFIPIDCTTIPSELMESELFGYEKGAFTCAYDTKVGLIEMANRGTVFFDEIGDLDATLQKKLLRFL